MYFESCFYLDDMSSLRYAIPFVKFVDLLIGEKIPIVYRSNYDSFKYNSIRSYSQNLIRICRNQNVTLCDVKHEVVEVQKVYCVENVVRSVKYDKMISFQHGFDFLTLAKKERNATYLVTDQTYVDQITSYGMNAILQPMPVSLWDWEENYNFAKNFLGIEKSATLFFPESRMTDKFKKVYDHFRSRGYQTYVKQRRKHQTIPDSFEKAFYDDVWYPTESVFLPIMSDITVGFETSAYTDLIYTGRNYIDFASSPLPRSFHKPDKNNFLLLDENFDVAMKQLSDTELPSLTESQKSINPCDIKKIESFLRSIT